MKQRRLAALLLCAALIMCMVPVCYAAVTVGPGDTGENVKKIQRRLIQYDYMSGTADGIYGEQTRQAVIKFQKKYGLTADGMVGPATAAKLGVSLSGRTLVAVPKHNRGSDISAQRL